jgi:hypothetical protein
MTANRAHLVNALGDHVCTIPLPTARIPEGILWAEGFFLMEEINSDGNPVYREGLLWVVPPETEVKR